MATPLTNQTANEREKYRIDFKASHIRYKNKAGKPVPGVTTVLGILNKPALLHWAWNLGVQGINLEAARQGAADIGTVAHALCEAHLRGMDLDAGNIAPDMLDRAETGFLRFLDFWQKEQLSVVHVELAMVSEAMQVGGTLDVLARRADGRLVLIDLKTSKGIYDEMLVQAATYAAMYEECHGEAIHDAYIVRIGKEDADDLEIRAVNNRAERATAFAALAHARRLLQAAGVKV